MSVHLLSELTITTVLGLLQMALQASGMRRGVQDAAAHVYQGTPDRKSVAEHESWEAKSFALLPDDTCHARSVHSDFSAPALSWYRHGRSTQAKRSCNSSRSSH